MYREHFGLRDAPFRDTVDPDVFFETDRVDQVCMDARRAVREGRGWILLAGDAGTGKTTVLRRLARLLADDGCRVVACPIGIAPADLDPLLAAAGIGGPVAVLVDEAQLVDPEVLQILDRREEAGDGSGPAIAVVLAGGPDLELSLAGYRGQFAGLVAPVVCWLAPLVPAEVVAYVRYRLHQTGGRADLFALEALERVAALSAGIPRVVNLLCDAALLHTALASEPRVLTVAVDRAAAAMELAPPVGALVVAPAFRSAGGRPVSRHSWGAGRSGLTWVGIAGGVAAAVVAFLIARPLLPREVRLSAASGDRAVVQREIPPPAATLASPPPGRPPDPSPPSRRGSSRAMAENADPAPAPARGEPVDLARQGPMTPPSAMGPEAPRHPVAIDPPVPDLPTEPVVASLRPILPALPAPRRDPDGPDAMLRAVTADRPAALRAFLDRTGGAEARTALGVRAVVVAAQQARFEVLRALLDHGASADARDRSGVTALMHAAGRGHTDVVRLLLERGADRGLTDEDGRTALAYALERSGGPRGAAIGREPPTAAWLARPDVVGVLAAPMPHARRPFAEPPASDR